MTSVNRLFNKNLPYIIFNFIDIHRPARRSSITDELFVLLLLLLLYSSTMHTLDCYDIGNLVCVLSRVHISPPDKPRFH